MNYSVNKNKMMKALFTLLFIGLLSVSSDVHAQVKNSSFNFTLKMLLSGDVPEISIADAAKDGNQCLFLDAREQKEYNVSHLPNTRFIGYSEFSMAAMKGIEKDKPLVVYCSIGKRSEDITRKLKKWGYTNVHNLYGGIFEWVNSGNTVYDLKDKPTDKVHAYGKLWGRFLEKGTKVY
ncbi:MAG: rhodanese-like domain-containing protein [Segetibacter sp.]